MKVRTSQKIGHTASREAFAYMECRPMKDLMSLIHTPTRQWCLFSHQLGGWTNTSGVLDVTKLSFCNP